MFTLDVYVCWLLWVWLLVPWAVDWLTCLRNDLLCVKTNGKQRLFAYLSQITLWCRKLVLYMWECLRPRTGEWIVLKLVIKAKFFPYKLTGKCKREHLLCYSGITFMGSYSYRKLCHWRVYRRNWLEVWCPCDIGFLFI